MEKTLKKGAVFFLLAASVLFPGKVVAADGQPDFYSYERKNTAGYVFDGHNLADVLLTPYATQQAVSVSKDVDLDDQVVYLYHPKSGKFLYPDGRWGTQAVARYAGFGLSLRIVDPTGSNAVNGAENWAGFNDASKPYVHYGFYSEASKQGHYLGIQDGDPFGLPPFIKNGVYRSALWVYVDRGGVAETDDDWDALLKVKGSHAEFDETFNWDLEPVTVAGQNDLHLYKLVLYARNNSKTATLEAPLYKHYIKLNEEDFFNDGAPFATLASASLNTEYNYNQVTGDENDPGDDDDYYWQIVTRKDLKQKFVLDFEDPYSVNVQTGSYNFIIENPDFNRPLYSTINTSDNAFWKESVEGVYRDNGNNNAENGRYYYFQPQKDGNISQSFHTLQSGLFRVDFQGFTSGNAKATAILTSEDANVLFSEGEEGVKGQTPFEKIEGSLDDNFNIESNIRNEAARNFQYDRLGEPGSGEPNNTNDWKLLWPNGDVNDPFAQGDYILGYVKQGVNTVYCTDAYGRQAVGVVVLGTKGDWIAPGNNGYFYKIGNDDWVNNPVVNLPYQENVTFGPTAVNNDWDDSHYVWYYPNGGHASGRQITKEIKYADVGDYICVYNDGNNNYAVFHYSVSIKDTPDPSHVLVGNTGATATTEAAVVAAAADGNYFFRQTSWNRVGADENIWLVENGNNVEGLYVNGAASNENVINAWQAAGEDGNFAEWDEVTHGGWHDNTNQVEVNAGQKFRFGPQPQWGFDYKWFGPDGFKADGREAVVENPKAGKYYFVAKNGNNEYLVGYYDVKVNGDAGYAPTADVNGSGNTYAIGNGVEFTYFGQNPNWLVKDDEAWNRLQGWIEGDINREVDTYRWELTNRFVGRYFYNNDDTFVKSLYFYVPEGSDNAEINLKFAFENINEQPLENFIALDNVRLTYYGDVPFVLDENATSTEYFADPNHKWIPVYMDRTFNLGKWNALVSPIPLNYGQLKEAFGDAVKVSKISDLGLNPKSPGTIVFNKQITSTTKDEDVVVTPGDFFIVNPSSVKYTSGILSYDAESTSGFITYSSNKLVSLGRHNLSQQVYTNKEGKEYASELLSDAERAPFKKKYYPIGSGIDHNSIELLGSYTTQYIPSADRSDSYVFTESNLVHLGAGADYELKAFRFYVHEIDQFSATGRAKDITFVSEEDGVIDTEETTGIAEAFRGVSDDESVYSISGQEVKNGNLRRGIYVTKNGKKYLVK